ncbi:MAG: hypothetical protein IMZ62_01525 [Chloroflexi bacterium]|nr:hypothetical protein [Chloroflexota bacterium]
MDLPQPLTEEHTPLDRNHFDKAVDAWIRPSSDLTGLRLLQQFALRERDLRELYRGRAPYELLQNADDVTARQAVFLLMPEGMAFGHSGRWFSVANFKSLAQGWSDKDPDKCIGHKGLGFRSVLDITPAPHVLHLDQRGFFGFKFTWAVNNGHIQDIFQQHPHLRAEYQKWTRHGQSACPVMAIPNEVKRASLGIAAGLFDRMVTGDFGKDLTTMFWFPAKDREADYTVLKELGVVPMVSDENGRSRMLDFLKNDVAVLLPFLSVVEEVSVYDTGSLLGKAHLVGHRMGPVGNEIRVDLTLQEGSSTNTFFQMHFTERIPPHIKNDAETPKAVKQMSEAEVRLSVRIEDGQPVFDSKSKFHVYFPTDEDTGMGFVIHGDFYIKPDRTRLMPGAYNHWLLGIAAKRFAGAFLTGLLEHYQPRKVLEALRPAVIPSTDAAKTFTAACSEALRRRKDAFVPSTAGLLVPQETIIPPSVDGEGFWVAQFADVVSKAAPTKRAFLSPSADSRESRRFLEFAGLEPLAPVQLLDFVEAAATAKPRAAVWWYRCYQYMATVEPTSRWEHPALAGRKLIPDADLNPVPVPGETNRVVCMPPGEHVAGLTVPKCFAQTFVFLNPELARLLRDGQDRIQHWFLRAFGIADFEATHLVPKAIAATVQQLFDGSLPIDENNLRDLWVFLQRIIALSRGILSVDFWQQVGRLPLPTRLDSTGSGPLRPASFVPAFLAYWPDTLLDPHSSLKGVCDFRRVAAEFFGSLTVSGASKEEWRRFFEQAGVSSAPKRIRYVRIVGMSEVPFAPGTVKTLDAPTFTGERQRDENLIVIENLNSDGLWDVFVRQSEGPGSEGGRALHSLSLMDGLGRCTRTAEEEYRAADPTWQQRLRHLVRSMPLDSLQVEQDKAFRRHGGGGGVPQSVGRYLDLQLAHYRWLPTSCGPRNSEECFVRLETRRLISRGAAGEELGDTVIPYVVVPSLEEYDRLNKLGVAGLDDAASTTAPALIRALFLLGRRMSEESAKAEILEVRSRWRLVRGAIQEIYRVLNQTAAVFDVPRDLLLAARESSGVRFKGEPLFYTEPGSPIERAFKDVLPLIDADRPYATLFDRLGIIRLTAGQTVTETFRADNRAMNAPELHNDIVNELGPFLLAVIIAKSDEQHHRDLVLLRLRERFEVKVADRLTVSFALTKDPGVEHTVDFAGFYLRREILDTPGAVKEAHYTLYVCEHDAVRLAELDGDALGEAIAPVFLDGASGELASLFPRVVSQFQRVSGDRTSMKEFLHQRLGVSADAQETAHDDIAGAPETVPPITLPTPPPIRIVAPTTASTTAIETSLVTQIQKHQETAGQALNALFKNLSPPRADEPAGKGPHGVAPAQKQMHITREQEVRGRRGEEEFKRRANLPGGYCGFALLQDRRQDSCGFDFLCLYDGRQVEVEVKTFALNGQVVLPISELRRAAATRGDYYLMGFLDDGPVEQWKSALLRDPVAHLMDKGAFEIDTVLRARANDIFCISPDGHHADRP